MENTLETQGAIKALKLAVKNRDYPEKPLVHYSDRGLQYCSNDYQELLAKSNIKCSMTESYDPYQNAVAERLNGILKQEFLINTRKVDIVIMRKIVKQSVRIYNTKRPHLSCDMLTPKQMHGQSNVKIKTYKKKIPQQTMVC